MARPKDENRDAKKVNLFIDKQINQRLDELARFEGMGKSAFVEMLILRWDEGINPESKLNSLFKKREETNSELNKIDSDIKKISDQITIFNTIKMQKNKKKPEAITVIEKLLVAGEYQRAEEVSKFWQKQTGISAFELFMEAKQKVDKEGR